MQEARFSGPGFLFQVQRVAAHGVATSENRAPISTISNKLPKDGRDPSQRSLLTAHSSVAMTAHGPKRRKTMSAPMSAVGELSGLVMRSAGRPARSRGCKSLAMKE